jgi:peptidoglycan hydrolase-like protein with peptidoglycan-binding domain
MPAQYPFKRSLSKGMKGRDVEVMQEWLRRVNEFDGFTNLPIFISGEYTQYTKWAVEKFQKSHNLQVTGIYDYPTYRWLERINIEAYAWEIGNTSAGGYWNN